MVSVNTVLLGGHLGAAPEERRTAAGKVWCTFRLATNRWDARAEAEVCDWHTVVAFERQAEHCIKHLQKGSPVIVEGRLAMRQWDGADGKKNTSYDVVATRVSFLGSGRGGGEARVEAPVEKSEPTYSGKKNPGFSADAIPF